VSVSPGLPGPASPGSGPAPEAPRRLDPRTLLLYGVRGFGPMLALSTPALISLWRGDDPRRTFIGLAIAGALGLLVLAATALLTWLNWRAFTYQIRPGEVIIARGLIHRSRRSIPAERIQDVSITRTPLSRLLGLAEVRIETGGADADEGKLNSVSLAEARRLRTVLRALGASATVAPSADSASPAPVADAGHDDETVVFRLGLPRLLLSGLFSFSLLWLFAPLGLLEYVGRVFDIDNARWFDLLRDAGREAQSHLSPALALGVAATVFAAGVLAGMARTVLGDYGFTLTRADGRLRTRRGLLTRNEVVVAARRIQLGMIERGVLAGRLGWRALRVQTLGGGGEPGSGRQTLAPFARVREIEEILPLTGLPDWREADLKAVSPRHAVGGVLEALPLAAVLIAAAVVWPPAAWAGPMLLLPLGVALLRPAAHRYSLASEALQVRRGVLARRDWIVPWHRIQSVTVWRGPLQQRLGLATVRIDTAGAPPGFGGPHIHDLPEAEATALAAALLERIAASR
jgi:putative membrane protein